MSKLNLVINQGSVFHFEADLLDANNQAVNTAIYTMATATLKKTPQSNVAYNFVVGLGPGLIILSMTSNSTALIPYGDYVYNAFVYTANSVDCALEGLVTVTPQVTTNGMTVIGSTNDFVS